MKIIIQKFGLVLLFSVIFGTPAQSTEILIEPKPVVTAQKLKLGLNWKPEPQFGGFYEAQRLGLFDSKFFSIEILPGGSGTPTLQMLLSKQLDFAIVSGDELVIAASRGNNQLVALFAVYQKNPQALMAHKSTRAVNIQDLLSMPGTLQWQEGLPYVQFLKKKYSNIQRKTAPYLGGIGPFLSDKDSAQQCFVGSESLLAEKAKAPVKVFLVAESGYNPYTTVLAVRREFLRDQRPLVTKVLAAVREGWVSYLKDPHPTHVLMAKLNPSFALEDMDKSAQSQAPLIQSLNPKDSVGGMTGDRWQTLVDQLYELNIIKTKPKVQQLFEAIK